MIRKDLVQRKISLIQNELEKLSGFSKHTFEEVVADPILQAALERFLERIITRAIDINEHIISGLATKEMLAPQNYYETFVQLSELGIYPKVFAQNIAKSVGTRNVLVHQYDNVDYGRIYSSIQDCLRDYHAYIDYLISFLKKLPLES